MRIVTASEMREIDRHAIETVGINSLVLMENAGLKVLFALEKALSGLRGKRFTVVCGKGNNGGDGLVVARHLFNNGVSVNVFIISQKDDMSPDAKANLKILENSGLHPFFMSGIEDLTKLRVTLEFSDCVVDAIYGTGFSGQITGYVAEVIKVINDSSAKKVAVDVPSGLCSTTGNLSNPSIRADITITLGLPKLGLYLYPGLEAVGEIWMADIGIPRVSVEAVPGHCALLSRYFVSTLMPPRRDDSFKGTFGKVLILAGSKDYQGAGIFATYGALRSGVGLVTLGMPEKVALNLSCEVLPDVIVKKLPEVEGGFSLEENEISNFTGTYGAIVAGPGWGKGGARNKSIENLLKFWVGNLLLDADALNALGNSSLLGKQAGELIITPHLGEMATLTGRSVAEVKTDAINIVREFAVKHKCIVVLKSSVTIVFNKNGDFLVCSRPNSGLAKGGSGDLLAGLIGGLLAQGIPPFNAAAIGTFLHSEAGEIARKELGADAMTISEVASFVPKAFKRLRGEEQDEAPR